MDKISKFNRPKNKKDRPMDGRSGPTTRPDFAKCFKSASNITFVRARFIKYKHTVTKSKYVFCHFCPRRVCLKKYTGKTLQHHQ